MESENNVLEPGTTVSLKTDPGRQGTITKKHRVQAGIRKYQVAFPEGKSFHPFYELEVISDDESDWTSLLKKGRFGRIDDLRRNLTHVHLSGRLANLVYSMDVTNTDFLAYQYKPVLSFLNSPSNGLLIADEVGLGKTIEAGLIWTELRARYDARRLLVVCKAILREKWCDELSNRFGVDAEIMSAQELLRNLQKSKYTIPDGKAIVCSLQGLRPPSDRTDNESVPNARRELSHFLNEQSENESIIDLVIIDEAHDLRNPGTSSAKLGQLLRDVTENIVLLSATPINLKSDDLYHLLNLVDPDSFGVKDVFPQVLAANAHLIEARKSVLDPRKKGADILEELQKAIEHPLLSNSRQLSDLLSIESWDEHLSSNANRVKLANQIDRVNLLKNAVTRTRKSEVEELRVIREPVKKFVELDTDGPEWEFYESVTNTIRKYAWENDINDGFLLANPQKQVSSCMYAAAKAWLEKIDGYNEQIDEDQSGNVRPSSKTSPLIDRLRTDVLPKIDLESLRQQDSKYKEFSKTIVDFLKNHPDQKVITFSFYRKTLSYLSERLDEDGIKNQILMGGMKEKKQDIIDRFRESPEIRVLLASEVVSEGVDLQFCRVLVNYDLPWNPMKIEQRIGRIDRIGQKAEKISIINLLHANTIDEKIHDRLYSRLRLFERALGDMEAILGEEVSKLTSALLSKPLTQEQENERVDQTALAIERIHQDQTELEEKASHLIAHAGYILDEVHAAHQFKKRITAHDLISYVKDYLYKYCENFEFRQLKPDHDQFDIKLPPNVSASLGEFIKKKKLYGVTSLERGSTVSCHFANKVRQPRNRYEVINQFHPLIRFIGDDLGKKQEAYYPLVAIQVETRNIGSFDRGCYAFFVQRWVFTGLKIEEVLSVRVLRLDSGEMFSQEESWTLVNHGRLNGKDWFDAGQSIEMNAFANALDNQCVPQLEADFESIIRQKTNENEDRVEFQIKSAKKYRDRQLKKLYETLKNYRATGKTQMIPAMEGRIRKIKERFDVQLETFQLKSTLNGHSVEVCCGAILCT